MGDKGWALTLHSSLPFLLPSLPKLRHIDRMFPVNLNCATREDDHTTFDDNRVIAGEVDFFSDRSNKASLDVDDHPQRAQTLKEDISRHVNVSFLHLHLQLYPFSQVFFSPSYIMFFNY